MLVSLWPFSAGLLLAAACFFVSGAGDLLLRQDLLLLQVRSTSPRWSSFFCVATESQWTSRARLWPQSAQPTIQ